LEYPEVVFSFITTTKATNNKILQGWEMADNAPRIESVFIGREPLPLAAKAKRNTALESGCGLDIM
jgi:hypothetical protein